MGQNLNFKFSRSFRSKWSKNVFYWRC